MTVLAETNLTELIVISHVPVPGGRFSCFFSLHQIDGMPLLRVYAKFHACTPFTLAKIESINPGVGVQSISHGKCASVN